MTLSASRAAINTRRSHTRLRLPIRALLGGHAFPLIDLSLRGCALRLGGGKASGLLPLTLVFPPHNGEAEQFSLWAEVVDHAADGRLALMSRKTCCLPCASFSTGWRRRPAYRPMRHAILPVRVGMRFA